MDKVLVNQQIVNMRVHVRKAIRHVLQRHCKRANLLQRKLEAVADQDTT